jgi:UDP-glucose 4-epimerase
MAKLITGGLGFIGVYLARALLQKGEEVVLFDVVSSSPLIKDIKDKVKIVQGNLASWAEVLEVVKRHQVDGIYHTFSGQIFDHCIYPIRSFKEGEKHISAVFGPTCDAFDTITLSADLPELELNDLVFSENIGAYTHASSTHFNGFPPAQVVHINK